MRRAQGGPPRLLRRQGSGTVWEGVLVLWNRARVHTILSRGLGIQRFAIPAEDPSSSVRRADAVWTHQSVSTAH